VQIGFLSENSNPPWRFDILFSFLTNPLCYLRVNISVLIHSLSGLASFVICYAEGMIRDFTRDLRAENSDVTDLLDALDFNLFPRWIAMETCGAAGFERACSAIAVLQKLNVGNLVPVESRQ
jgi:hypothetical protein